MGVPAPLELVPAEEKALLAFHGLLLETYMDDPSLRFRWYGSLKCDHPDTFNLRWLRACDLDPRRALDKMTKALHWRRDVHLDEDIMADGEPGALLTSTSPSAPKAEAARSEAFLRQFRMGKSYTHSKDAAGRSITTIRVRLHRSSAQPPDIMERFILWQIETVRIALAAESFPYPRHAPTTEASQDEVDAAAALGRQVRTDSIMIFDLTNFGINNMDYTPVKFIIETFDRYYPDALEGVIIHRAPRVFEMFWRIIRAWIPDYFTELVHFTRNSAELELLVPRANLVKEMGGDDEWEYAYVEPTGRPVSALSSDERVVRADLEQERAQLADDVDQVTCEWIDAVEQQHDAAALRDVRQRREVVIERLRRNYWHLDPLVRARGLLDEWGLIQNPVLDI